MAGAMSGISTHVLDLTLGKPAVGVHVRLEREDDGVWREVARGETDADGRIKSLLPPGEPLQSGRFRLGFETGAYFRSLGSGCFHPYIEIAFEVRDAGEHYHVPLLVTPHSYSTYRGS
jgi:5-hydroxyisourate hydrolase